MLCAAGAAWARGRDFGLREFWAAGRAFFWRAFALGLLMVAAVALVLANVVLLCSGSAVGWGCFWRGLMVWFLVLVGMVAVYVFPVLVTQEGSVWSTLRYSFLLSVDNVSSHWFFADRRLDSRSWRRFWIGVVLRRLGGLGLVAQRRLSRTLAQVHGSAAAQRSSASPART